MYVYTMLDAGTLCGFFQHFHQCACRVLLAGSIALEQPFLRTVFLEIFPKLVQHLFRQQRVTAFLTFAAVMKKEKFYVVWAGVTPGIYTSWTECQLQTKGYEGAKFKSFDTREEAEHAFAASPYDYIKRNTSAGSTPSKPSQNADAPYPAAVLENSLAVDAACSGNPGAMEYRGVHVASRQQVFHYGPVYGTNNIGEFLAIVHGLALLKQKGFDMPIYSDSVNAIGWVKQKKCKTKLPRDSRTEQLFLLIERAEKWLRENTYSTPILKWETRQWGEIPADFGRK